MEIKAYSTYDLKTTTALSHLNMFKKVDPKKRMRTFGILDAILFAFIIVELLAFGSSLPLWMMLAVLAIATLLYSYMYFIYPKITYKASGKFADIHNEFNFFDDEFTIKTSSKEYCGECKIEYTMLYRVMETSEYFFLFENKMSVFIVDKSTISGGTPEDIHHKLLPILLNQYIICKY